MFNDTNGPFLGRVVFWRVVQLQNVYWFNFHSKKEAITNGTTFVIFTALTLKFTDMKNTIFAALAALFLTACSSDPCQTVNCLNSGECNEGTCECLAQFEGEFCQTQWSQKFIGNWSGFGGCNGSNQTQNVSISQSQIDIGRLEFENGFYALVTESAAFSIPNQTYFDTENNATTQIIGSGTLQTNGQLLVNFNINVSGQTANCSFTLTK